MDKLETKTGAVEFAENVMRTAKINLETSGTLMPVSLLITTRGQDGRDLDKPEIVAIGGVFDGGDSKDVYSGAVKQMARELGAVGVLFLSESWTIDTSGLTPAQAEREIKKWTGRLDQHPRKKEIVFVTFEHIAFDRGSRLWLAEITRDAEGKPILGEFKPLPDADGMVGRFTNLLRRDRVN